MKLAGLLAEQRRAERLAKRGGHSSVIVALWLEPADAVVLAEATAQSPGLELYTEPPEEMHITLCYVDGDVDSLEPQREALLSSLTITASLYPPVVAQISGAGMFTPLDKEERAIYASVDTLALEPLRDACCIAIESAGCVVGTRYGFTPHITLAYKPAELPAVLPPVPMLPILFRGLTICWGDEKVFIPFGGATPSDRPPVLVKARGEEPDEAPPDDAARRRAEARLLAAIEQVYTEQQGIIRRATGRLSPQQIAQALADLTEPLEQAMYRRVLPLFEGTLGAAAEAGEQALGVTLDWGMVNGAVLDFARQEAARLARDTTKTSQAQMLDIVADWIASGGSRADLYRRVGAVFPSSRARTTASTEVTRMYALGNQIAYRESGVVKGLRLRTARDERVCPKCGPKYNQVVSIDAGPDELPPFHGGCRCWVVPVVLTPEEMRARPLPAPVTPAVQDAPTAPAPAAWDAYAQYLSPVTRQHLERGLGGTSPKTGGVGADGIRAIGRGLGYSPEVVEQFRSILASYGGAIGQQNEAMRQLRESVRANDELGRFAREWSRVEAAYFQAWKANREQARRRAFDELREELTRQATETTRAWLSPSDPDFDKEVAAELATLRARIEGEFDRGQDIYRNGSRRDIESWTLDQRVAARWLGESHATTIDGLMDEGYSILSGLIGPAGAPDEREITFINFDEIG